MSKNKIIGFVHSFVMIPMLMSSPIASLGSLNLIAFDTNKITVENSVITTQEEVARKEKAEAIDTYFKKHNAPLEGYGMKFVEEADKYGLDFRLLPAIAMRESTGGIHACKRVSNSVFGYGSCKISFDSIDQSIEIVAKSLGGENPNTERHYKDKTTLQILRKYNSVIPNYPSEVVRIMKSIQDDGKEIN